MNRTSPVSLSTIPSLPLVRGDESDAEKYLQHAFPVLGMEEQEIYEKNVEHLKKIFGI